MGGAFLKSRILLEKGDYRLGMLKEKMRDFFEFSAGELKFSRFFLEQIKKYMQRGTFFFFDRQ